MCSGPYFQSFHLSSILLVPTIVRLYIVFGVESLPAAFKISNSNSILLRRQKNAGTEVKGTEVNGMPFLSGLGT